VKAKLVSVHSVDGMAELRLAVSPSDVAMVMADLFAGDIEVTVTAPVGGDLPAVEVEASEGAPPSPPAEGKPPTQGIIVSGEDQSTVMKPSAPPPLFVKLTKLAHNPIFQVWIQEKHPAFLQQGGGDSLKAAHAFLQARVMSGTKVWGAEQDETATAILGAFTEWTTSKGYTIDE
jgi:hypothetical protein